MLKKNIIFRYVLILTIAIVSAVVILDQNNFRSSVTGLFLEIGLVKPKNIQYDYYNGYQPEHPRFSWEKNSDGNLDGYRFSIADIYLNTDTEIHEITGEETKNRVVETFFMNNKSFYSLFIQGIAYGLDGRKMLSSPSETVYFSNHSVVRALTGNESDDITTTDTIVFSENLSPTTVGITLRTIDADKNPFNKVFIPAGSIISAQEGIQQRAIIMSPRIYDTKDWLSVEIPEAMEIVEIMHFGLHEKVMQSSKPFKITFGITESYSSNKQKIAYLNPTTNKWEIVENLKNEYENQDGHLVSVWTNLTGTFAVVKPLNITEPNKHYSPRKEIVDDIQNYVWKQEEGKKHYLITDRANTKNDKILHAAALEKIKDCSVYSEEDLFIVDKSVELDDIQEHWASCYITDLYLHGAVQGRGDTGKYFPDEQITRAEFLKIMMELNNYPLDEKLDNPFADVNLTEWYAPYVLEAYQEGVISGYQEDGQMLFKPAQSISRAEALKIIFASKKAIVPANNTSHFLDVIPDTWYIKYVNYADKLNIIAGRTAKRFAPHYSLTRAEAAKIVYQFFNIENIGENVVEEWVSSTEILKF